MSAAVIERGAERDARAIGPTPFARLLRMEWRKQVDTRASRWLLALTACAVLVVLVVLGFVDGGRHSFEQLAQGALQPLGILAPVIAILSVTAEWSQRTALVTFALEPRRARVIVAKTLAALGVAALAVAGAVALAAVEHLALIGLRDVEPRWSVDLGALGGTALAVLVLGVLCGVGFGLLLLNTPGAIVAYFVAPIVIALLGTFVPALKDAQPWFDMATASTPLVVGAMTGQAWLHLASTTAIWVVAPFVVGLVRVLRSEIRSA
ncbi:ABC transporter permease [Xylanimonas ulmi]|uniref:ABC-2 family transporter n=1 Tax=Xylanimonas ulmi TaxID=228973 RepID=A0A4Q7M823_9MICO|nr:ABC transporter permease [Xylanibacterium ulmi]RZS63267.1 hypothetical protein EV386_3630 [Xylanibacterium ulmi]